LAESEYSESAFSNLPLKNDRSRKRTLISANFYQSEHPLSGKADDREKPDRTIPVRPDLGFLNLAYKPETDTIPTGIQIAHFK